MALPKKDAVPYRRTHNTGMAIMGSGPKTSAVVQA